VTGPGVSAALPKPFVLRLIAMSWSFREASVASPAASGGQEVTGVEVRVFYLRIHGMSV
jgi:hypothetical protein